MADTRQNITVPSKEWIDLYALTGIGVGTKIIVQNVGSNDVFLFAGANAPTVQDSYVLCRPYEESINETSDSGAWVYSLDITSINVRVAV